MPTIKIKGSSTAAAEPLTLAERELAVNVTDKKLYVGDGAAVRKIVGSLGNQEASAVAITGGSIAGITDLAVADGGTGASTAADARTNLGITATGADTTYAFRSNNLSDLASASTARTNLGLGSIATQASSSVSITGGSITGVTDIAIADGGTGASTAADARTNLGLGSIATQSASSVSITGGTISGITDLAVADGGTGASTAADARTNLSVPSTTGSGASGTWGIDISGNAATATSATSATTATNLAGGAANRVPYQSASGTTTFVAAPTVTNSYLKWNGTALGWDTVSGGGGGGTPGGSNTQVQFNDGGSFGGDAGLTYDKTTDVLTVAGSFNGPVGATTANTGAFTTLSASSTVSGSGFSTYLASPPAIGGTAAAAGSFTTLSASSTVSGTGFSTYLASPPAIGGTAAAAGTFTTLTANGNTTLGDATTDTITLTGTVQPGVVISGSSSGDALRITQTGTGNALLVEDETNPDSTPFVVNASGNVGIGTSSPAYKLDVIGSSRIQSSSGYNFFFQTSATTARINYLNDAFSANISAAYRATDFSWQKGDGSEILKLDSSGNLGLGVTPSAWRSTTRALQIGSTSSFQNFDNGGTIAVSMGNNFYWNSSDQAIYIQSKAASNYYQTGGQHVWQTAASGTAGNTITFTQAMTLDASGNLGVGTTSPTTRVHAVGDNVPGRGQVSMQTSTAANFAQITFYDRTTLGAQIYQGYQATAGVGDLTIQTAGASSALVFGTNATERARITSGGNLLLKDTNDVTVTGPSGAIISALSVGGSFIISVAFSVASPYTQNIQIDITWGNWGSNNVIGLVDLMAQTRQWANTSGAAFGKVFATNTGATATFSTFNTTNITTSQCTLTAASGGNYTLRLTIDPTNNMDAAGVYLTIPRGISVLPTTVAVSLV